jgi:hypothetical protein
MPSHRAAFYQGFEPDGAGGRAGRLFGLHLTTAGVHAAPSSQTPKSLVTWDVTAL